MVASACGTHRCVWGVWPGIAWWCGGALVRGGDVVIWRRGEVVRGEVVMHVWGGRVRGLQAKW